MSERDGEERDGEEQLRDGSKDTDIGLSSISMRVKALHEQEQERRRVREGGMQVVTRGGVSKGDKTVFAGSTMPRKHARARAHPPCARNHPPTRPPALA